MTIEEFQQNGPFQKRLTEILADPAFLAAVSAVRESTEPRAGENDMNPVKKAALYDQRAGFNLLLSRLKALTKPPVERREPRIKALARTPDDLPPDQ